VKRRPEDSGQLAALLVELRGNPDLRRELARILAPDTFGAAVAQAQVNQAPYTTRRGEGPDGVPDRKWKRIAASIGKRPHPRARWLIVDREVYQRSLAGDRAPAPAPSAPVPIAEAWAETFDMRAANRSSR
jgi:hypothetical protein